MIEVKTILTRPTSTGSYLKPSPTPYCGHYINKHTKQTHQQVNQSLVPNRRVEKGGSNISRKRKYRGEDPVDSSSSSSEVQVIANATFRYDLLYIPRILKNDLRRQYPIMFMNVFNSGDYQFMKKWMETFSNGDISFLLEAPGNIRPALTAVVFLTLFPVYSAPTSVTCGISWN